MEKYTIEVEGQEVLQAGGRLPSRKSCVECQESLRRESSKFVFSLGSSGRIGRCPVTSGLSKKDIWSLARTELFLATE